MNVIPVIALALLFKAISRVPSFCARKVAIAGGVAALGAGTTIRSG